MFLFLQPKHLLLQKNEDTWVLFAESKKGIEILTSIFLEKEKAFSPLRMSFGGIMAKETISYFETEKFIDFLLNFCQNKGVKKLTITNYPFSYAPNFSAICSQIFLQKGFLITNAELTHYLSIENSFEENLHLSALRRLKKCQKNNFKFEHWHEPDLRFVYDFVANNRKRKNYPISMSFENFQNTIDAFPDNYLIFVLKNEQEIIALTVAVVINKDILYNFYPADKQEYLQYSPMIMLMAELFEFAKQKGFSILDLGISTEKSKPNYGLIRFKENLACKKSLKLSFTKNLGNCLGIS
ncbi:MAG: GNAT family N-acetyltransferase [Raineya sp.]